MTPRVPWLVLLLSLPFAALAAEDGTAVFELAKASPQVQAEVTGYREDFQGMGYRFDEASGNILDPKTKGPLTVAEVAALLSDIQTGQKFQSLQSINQLLAKQDPAKPLSPELVAQLREFAADSRMAVPDSIKRAIEKAASAPAGALKTEAWNEYLASTRYFDGQQGLSGYEKAAVPAGDWGKWPSPARAPNYFDDTERKLGQALQADIVADFSKYPRTGPELLSHFKDGHGRIKLPAVLVLKTQPEEGADADSESDSIVLNALMMTEEVVAQAPAKDRAALAKKLSDPRKLDEYLLANPQARARFIADNDVPIYHELTHSTQFLRDRFSIEMDRGNAPDFDPLEWEQEAFLAQNRFLNEKLQLNPQEAIKTGYLPYYQQMLADYEGWRRGINQLYLSHPVFGSADLPTAEQLQNERSRAARHLAGSGVREWVIAKLKAVGYKHGDEQMERSLGAAKSNVDKFGQSYDYQRMRVEGQLNLAKAFEQAGRTGAALESALSAGDAVKSSSAELKSEFSAPVKEESDKIVRLALAQLKSGVGDVDDQALMANALASRGLVPAGQIDAVALAYLKEALSLRARSEEAAQSWFYAAAQLVKKPASPEIQRLFKEWSKGTAPKPGSEAFDR